MGDPVNVFKAFTSKAEVQAVQAKTSTTDHQSILADVFGNERNAHLPHGRFNGSAAITITSKLQITADRGAELRFADGAYTALRFTTGAAQLSTVQGLFLRGTNATTPAITLLKFDSQAAYNVIHNCRFAFASKALSMDGVYVTKMIGNEFSNCVQYLTLDDTTFGVADVWCAGNTYGTNIGATLTGTTTAGSAVVTGLSSTTNLLVGMEVSTSANIPLGRTIASIDSPSQVTLNSGTSVLAGSGTIRFSNTSATPLVAIACPGVRMESEYWETQGHGQVALAINTGAQTFEGNLRLEASGEVLVQTSVEAWLRLRSNDSYSNAGNRLLRVDGGANAYLSHSQMRLATLDASKTAISGAGGVVADMVDISKFGVGALLASTGTINSGQIRGCATGVQFNSGSTASLGRALSFVGNTTNVVNNSGGTAAAPGSFTGALTGCTATPAPFCRYEVDNGVVTLSLGAATGTSNATTMTMTGVPPCLQPAGSQFVMAYITDNGVTTVEQADITGGTITFRKGLSTTGFTSTGTKGVQSCVISYRLRNV